MRRQRKANSWYPPLATSSVFAPEVDAVAIISQYAADAAALHVSVHAGLPGIDLGGQQRFGGLDHGPRPLRYRIAPCLHLRVIVFQHEPQQAGLEFHTVFDGLGDIAARGVRPQHHQHVGKASASMPR